jgi:hypothetical protein
LKKKRKRKTNNQDEYNPKNQPLASHLAKSGKIMQERARFLSEFIQDNDFARFIRSWFRKIKKDLQRWTTSYIKRKNALCGSKIFSAENRISFYSFSTGDDLGYFRIKVERLSQSLAISLVVVI